ncbi:MAG: hypothetical protein AAF645_24830, partial [Myxococcota bacterium]
DRSARAQVTCRPSLTRVPRGTRVGLVGTNFSQITRITIGSRSAGIIRRTNEELVAAMPVTRGEVVLYLQDGGRVSCGTITTF